MVGLFLFPLNLKIKGLYNLKKKNLVFNVYALKGLIRLKLNIFESNGSWYYQINKRDFKRFKDESKFKINFNYNDLPKIKIDKLYINVVYNPDSESQVGVVVSFLRNILDVIIPLLDPTIKVEDYRFNSLLKVEDEDIMNFQIDLNVNVIKSLYFILKNVSYKQAI